MGKANHIIDALGGTSIVATALSVSPSVVHGWRTTNSIPRWRQADVLSLAMGKGVALSTADFPTRDERISRAVTA